ncbi:MAG: bifunctional glutamate N-acetyltransferase/amino-acid acetyltransferase ArgJ [Planctomycetes bacterium]|nr:bifunctional glutamate N-acetyltransferase/amino-acid acetyltransferase ArgJ [Planctomycetota bacterium]
MPLPPSGFRLSGVHCGIKTRAGAEDIALIVSDGPSVAAGVYTQNLFRAAPVDLDRQRTPSPRIRAVVSNAGNANACTGEQGMRDAAQMTRLVSQSCGVDAEDVLVMSTGVIGEPMPMEKIACGIAMAANRLGTDESAFLSAARGLTTTDRSHKVVERNVDVAGGRRVAIAGMAKGAGMIGPRMATMLGVLLTDAALEPDAAQSILAEAVDESFNAISVEGHTSTNDTVLLLASGHGSDRPLAGADLDAFREGLASACVELAKMIPDDGEGATHLIAIDVRGCRTREDAKKIARTVAASPLVKCAITGGGPYWGRIVSAAGYAGVPFDPSGVSVSINGFAMFESGQPKPFDSAAASRSIRSERETRITLTFREGSAATRFWTSDLTVAYVTFNADYKT